MIVPGKPTAEVPVVRRHGDRTEEDRDLVAVEEPLEIRLAWWEPGSTGGRPADGTGDADAFGESGRSRRRRAVAVTMRTPGDDFQLAAGFLFGEGIVRSPDHLVEITYCRGGEPQEYNVVEARLRPGVHVDPSLVTRNFYTTSSCGVCGKASLEAVEVRGCEPVPPGPLRLEAAVVSDLPGRLRDAQDVFRRTGGLHGAGLFDGEGRLRSAREDVGRHNAVDKVVGEAFLARRIPLDDAVLVVSGRASFEILQKALAARIPAVVAVGAPSSLAVELAERFGLTLVGFARDGGFNVYAGPERIA